MKIRSRRGVTLIELLIAMVIASVLGGALISLMMATSRFEGRAEGAREARRVGRSAINALVSELRMTDPEWGMEAASASSVTVRAPYALGLTCSSSATSLTLMLLPADSVALAIAGLSGFAWRQSGGAMAPVTTTLAATFPGTTPGACTSAGIQVLAAPANAPNARSRPITLAGTGMPVVAVGTPVMLYRRVRYYFAVSAQAGITGRTALWRDYLDDAAAAVELAGPFDASAAFRFFNLGATTAQTAVPTLTDIRGLELFLPGESDRTLRQRVAPEQADVTTAVFFINRRS